jgi:hypothetical protein
LCLAREALALSEKAAKSLKLAILVKLEKPDDTSKSLETLRGGRTLRRK